MNKTIIAAAVVFIVLCLLIESLFRAFPNEPVIKGLVVAVAFAAAIAITYWRSRKRH